MAWDEVRRRVLAEAVREMLLPRMEAESRSRLGAAAKAAALDAAADRLWKHASQAPLQARWAVFCPLLFCFSSAVPCCASCSACRTARPRALSHHAAPSTNCSSQRRSSWRMRRAWSASGACAPSATAAATLRPRLPCWIPRAIWSTTCTARSLGAVGWSVGWSRVWLRVCVGCRRSGAGARRSTPLTRLLLRQHTTTPPLCAAAPSPSARRCRAWCTACTTIRRRARTRPASAPSSRCGLNLVLVWRRRRRAALRVSCHHWHSSRPAH